MNGININRTNGIFKGLKVYNKNSKLEFSEFGDLTIRNNTYNVISDRIISNITDGNIIYKSNSGNININCNNNDKNIIIKSGTNVKKEFNITPNNIPLLSQNDIIDLQSTSGYIAGNVNKSDDVFDTKEKVINLLSNSSLLIESNNNNIETKSGISLYSNNGINQIAHNNINIITDNELLLQASNKINLTALDYLTINSEKLITNIEDEIIFMSSSEDIKLGGNGLTYGLQISKNDLKNYISIGYNKNSPKNLIDININENSYDDNYVLNNNKNGICINNLNNTDVFPEIKLKNFRNNNSNIENNTKFNLGIGYDKDDKNNKIFVKKNNLGTRSYIEILNDHTFKLEDVDKTIIYDDTSIENDIIIEVSEINNKRAYINNFIEQPNTFGYQLGYILRDDISYLKTSTNTNINLGINNENIINLNKNGNIGINNTNPEGNLDIYNDYGKIKYIRLEKNKKYYNFKTLNLLNNTFIIVCKTKINNIIDIELFLYNSNNKKLINNIKLSNLEFDNKLLFNPGVDDIDFDISRLINPKNEIVLVYSYIDTNVLTKTILFNNDLSVNSSLFVKNHINLNKISKPIVRSIKTGLLNGYLIGYLEQISNINNTITITFEIYSSTKVAEFNINLEIKRLIGNSIYNFSTFNLDLLNNTGSSILLLVGNFETEKNAKKNYYNISNKIEIKFSDNSFTISKGSVNQIINDNNFDITKFKTFGINLKKYMDQNTLKYLISYYIIDISNNNVTDICFQKLDNVGKVIDNSLFKLKKPSNYNITNINTTIYHYYPSIHEINNNFLISYIYFENDIFKMKYYDTFTLEYVEDNYPGVNYSEFLKINDNNEKYKELILLWESNISSNNFENGSILFKELDGINKLISIKNTNSNFEIFNNGNININNTNSNFEIFNNGNININNNFKLDKTGNIKNIILNKNYSSLTKLNNLTKNLGEIQFIGSKLYICINDNNNNVWKEIKLV